MDPNTIILTLISVLIVMMGFIAKVFWNFLTKLETRMDASYEMLNNSYSRKGDVEEDLRRFKESVDSICSRVDACLAKHNHL